MVKRQLHGMHSGGGSPYGLGKDDVLLGVQTEFQRDMMLLHGDKFICADSTHKSTQYDYLLTTLSVVDDFGEACPVAFLISNKEDQASLEPFMQALRNRVGELKVEEFMSDLANTLYNSWCAVFPKPTKRFYCSWHVDKNWKANVISKEKSLEKQSEIYAFLKTLQYETAENNFTKMLTQFLAYLEDQCPAFLSPPHTVATLRDCPREDWLATHEDWLATGISTSFWRLVKTEHVRSSVPQSRKVAKSLDSVRAFATCRNWSGRRQPISECRALPNI